MLQEHISSGYGQGSIWQLELGFIIRWQGMEFEQLAVEGLTESPGKRGRWLMSSAKMQPMDHKSTAQL